MDINEYQTNVENLSNYNPELGPFGVVFDLTYNIGNLSKKLQTNLYENDGNITDKDKGIIAIALSDVLGNIAVISDYLGIAMSDLQSLNLRKLTLQKEMETKNKSKS